MASSLSLLLFFNFISLILTLPIPPSSSPLHPPPPPPPPAPPHQKPQEVQLNNIIEALIGAGDFGNWANLLSAADPSILPISATLFIPGDDAVANEPIGGSRSGNSSPLLSFDPFVFLYHIVPQRLSFSDLLLFHVNARLPTLLPGKSLLITNNSRFNFTIDDSPVTYPDLYINAAVSVQGIGAIFDYTIYGLPSEDGLSYGSNSGSNVDSGSGSESESESESGSRHGHGHHRLRQSPPPAVGEEFRHPMFPAGELVGGGMRSEAACFCAEFPILLPIVVCSIFAFKIQRFSIAQAETPNCSLNVDYSGSEMMTCCFGRVIRVGAQHSSHKGVLVALIEQWWDMTSSLHFLRIGEMSITLAKYFAIMSFEMGKDALVLMPCQERDVAELLDFPIPFEIGRGIKLATILQFLQERAEEMSHEAQFKLIYLHSIGNFLHANGDNSVDKEFLCFLSSPSVVDGYG
ncbi:hypothetical protein Ancab_019135 [Ancistrocladus abbreviatus]